MGWIDSVLRSRAPDARDVVFDEFGNECVLAKEARIELDEVPLRGQAESQREGGICMVVHDRIPPRTAWKFYGPLSSNHHPVFTRGWVMEEAHLAPRGLREPCVVSAVRSIGPGDSNAERALRRRIADLAF